MEGTQETREKSSSNTAFGFVLLLVIGGGIWLWASANMPTPTPGAPSFSFTGVNLSPRQGLLLGTSTTHEIRAVSAPNRGLLRDAPECRDWGHAHYGATADCQTEKAGTLFELLDTKEDTAHVRHCGDGFCVDGWIEAKNLIALPQPVNH